MNIKTKLVHLLLVAIPDIGVNESRTKVRYIAWKCRKVCNFAIFMLSNLYWERRWKFYSFRMKDIAGKYEETFENISQTFEESAGNVTEEAIVQPPRWQEWLDNSQTAISVIGKSLAVRCHHKFYIPLNSIASFSLKNGDLNSTTNQNMFHFITILTKSKLSDILLAIIHCFGLGLVWVLNFTIPCPWITFICIVGLITNFGTFLTLAINGEEFAPCIRLLLKHQSLIDSFACLVAGLQVLQTPFWVAGQNFLLYTSLSLRISGDIAFFKLKKSEKMGVFHWKLVILHFIKSDLVYTFITCLMKAHLESKISLLLTIPVRPKF